MIPAIPPWTFMERSGPERSGQGSEAELQRARVDGENRNGLVADVEVLPAQGTAEREARWGWWRAFRVISR